MGALRQSVNKGVDRCVSLTTSTSTWQWRACVPSRGEASRFSPSHTMSYVQEKNGPGPTLACQDERRGGVLFLLQVGRLPNQGPNGLQLGAAPRMLEVTDCGTAVHHVQDMHQASTLRDLPTYDREPNNNKHHHHQPPPGQAGRSGSMQVGLFPLFPRATPHQPAPRGPPHDALKRPATGFQTAWAGCFVRPARKKQSLSECFDLRYSNLHKIVW